MYLCSNYQMIGRNISLFSRYHPFSIADNRSMQINNSSFAGYISTTDYADVTDFTISQFHRFHNFTDFTISQFYSLIVNCLIVKLLRFLRFRLHAATDGAARAKSSSLEFCRVAAEVENSSICAILINCNLAAGIDRESMKSE